MKYSDALQFARHLRKNQTNEEKILWEKIRKRKLNGYRFNRQFIIKHQHYNSIGFFIVDFYCHEAKLIIEIDGPIHNHQKKYDQWREEVLKSQEFEIIRFTNSDINKRLETVIANISFKLSNPTLSFE